MLQIIQDCPLLLNSLPYHSLEAYGTDIPTLCSRNRTPSGPCVPYHMWFTLLSHTAVRHNQA